MKRNNDLYEVMPYTQGEPYRDDVINTSELESEAKRTAIITLILVLGVSLLVIVAIVGGLQMLRDASGL